MAGTGKTLVCPSCKGTFFAVTVHRKKSAASAVNYEMNIVASQGEVKCIECGLICDTEDLELIPNEID